MTGDLLLKTFDKETDSGNVISRSFCPNCGSFLFIASKAHPDIRVVTAGSMDFVNGKSEWAPRDEYFATRRADWLPELDCTRKHT